MASKKAGGGGGPKLTDFERDRLKRIEENKRRMLESGLLDAAAQLNTQIALDKAKAKKLTPRKQQYKHRIARAPGSIRKSARIRNQPVVSYAEIIHEVGSRSAPKELKPNRRRIYDGLEAAIGALEGPVAWYAMPRGWKPQLGCASLEAAEAATAAALKLVQEIKSKGRHACIKLMTESQVSGGCWSQMPLSLPTFYGDMKKERLVMFSTDQQHREPGELWNSRAGSSTTWDVVYLPRKGGGGWSGGWRGFACDHMLTPNDTVVFEVLDNAEFEQQYAAAEAEAARMRAAARAAAGAEEAAAAAAAESAADGASEEPAASGDNAAGADDSSAGNEEPGELEAEDSQQDSAPGSQDNNSEEQENNNNKENDAADVPLVYKDTPKERMHVKVFIFRASKYEAPRAAGTTGVLENQQHQQQVAAAGDLTEQLDAAADDVSQQPEASPAAAAAAAAAASPARGAAAAAAAATAPKRSARKRAQDAAAAAANAKGPGSSSAQKQQAGKKRARGEGAKQEQEKDDNDAAAAAGAAGSKSKKARTSAAAAPGRAGKAGKQQQQQRVAKKPAAAGAGSSGGKKRQVNNNNNSSSSRPPPLVSQPANPKLRVPTAGPTEDEVQRDAAGGPFVVERIMEHKVDAKTGQDKFLIRWETFGSYWDSWETEDCLDEPPRAYTWHGGKKSIPAKFLQ